MPKIRVSLCIMSIWLLLGIPNNAKYWLRKSMFSMRNSI